MRHPGFDTRTIMTCAAIGVAGSVFLVPAYLVMATMVVTVPPVAAAVHGFYYLPQLVALALLRRPGVGVLASTVGGLICVPLSSLGWLALVLQFVGGVLMEVPFLLTRYRRWGTPMFVASAAVIGTGGAVPTLLGEGAERFGPALSVTLVVIAALAAGLYGFLAVRVARAVAKAGVLGGPLPTSTAEPEPGR